MNQSSQFETVNTITARGKYGQYSNRYRWRKNLSEQDYKSNNWQVGLQKTEKQLRKLMWDSPLYGMINRETALAYGRAK